MAKQQRPKMERYTRKDFERDFPNDEACLEWLMRYAHPTYPKGIPCTSATCKSAIRKHHRVQKRRSYSCDVCGHHVFPAAGTIFHKSSTSLRVWFLAIFLMSSTRTGVPAKWLERESGVTYKTAWRIFKQVRSMLDEGAPLLGGTVEVDETYFGGKRPGLHGPKGPNKQVIMGFVERGGRAYAEVVPNVKKSTLLPMIEKYVAPGSTIYTDELMSYKALPAHGYPHQSVNHLRREFVRGDVHTNAVEGFWGNMKRGIDGAHHHVSPKYLQRYVDEFAFRFNHRLDEKPMFHSMLRQVSA
jgi:transposase-like protein